MKKYNIAVLGGGNAGFAIAGFFSHLGHDVQLYKKSLTNHQKLIDYRIVSKGVVEFESRISLVTNSMKQALEGAELIIVTVPAYCHDAFFDELIEFHDQKAMICLMPDNYGGFLLIKKLQEKGLSDFHKVISLNSVLFACRQIDHETTSMKGVKKEIMISSVYPGVTDEGLRMLNDIYPIFKKGVDIFEVLLSNMNPVVHTATTLLNAGWIETTEGDFDFYKEGISPSVANYIERIDNERIAIGSKLGIRLDSLLINMHKLYGSIEKDLYSSLSRSGVHTKDLAPASLETRYINEDIPYGLMPMSRLGKLLNVQTKAIDTIISLSEIMLDKVFDETASDNLETFLKAVRPATF
ncbi:MAG: NAD/NADP octopine/nopaline dehydrogenase family protein [Eubacteriales bacterium]|nr:NAD/NADP octopine/nopaline dehydrogenase family protein [Eubacteriales bacterium]